MGGGILTSTGITADWAPDGALIFREEIPGKGMDLMRWTDLTDESTIGVLLDKKRERFTDCLVFPVFDGDDAGRRVGELLGGFVESLGFSAAEAESGEDALESIRRQLPDMVLLDVRLPGISGIDAGSRSFQNTSPRLAL